MKSTWAAIAAALALAAFSSAALAQDAPKKYEDFAKLVAGAKEIDGLFKLHHKDENLFAEIRQDQFNKPFLAPLAIAKGGGAGGYTLNFDEQWVLVFKRVGDKVFVIRRNVRFKAKPGTPVADAVETTYSDSVLESLRVRAINPAKNTVVIDLADLYLNNFADLRLGAFDRSRTTWNKIKAFPKNIELQVAATFSNRGTFSSFRGDSDAVIDPRGATVVIHYGLVELPSDGYQPRLADDRVGHFLTAVKDFSSESADTAFVRYVNRWRLERADGKSTWKEGEPLSPPKKRIVFWVEKTVPHEYRAAVREGILEWNKAFEKIGFRDAIEVRQQESEEFDPEDVNYNTFRWITTDLGFAMGPSRANPLTGEILDADIIFDASMVRFYQEQRQLFAPTGDVAALSAIAADKQPLPPLGWDDRNDPLHAVRMGLCRCATHKRSELALALSAVAIRADVKPGERLPDELVQQAVKEVTMHEVGHTLGLRHNFKASTFLKNEQLHDTAITRKVGLVGSVMDYAPVNLAPKGVKQGDFFTTTLGPYDYWAIEYAYKPLSGNTEGEKAELAKIASRCATPGYDYLTDEDMFGTSDPLVNTWDLGSDPMKFAQDRMMLAEELMKGLADRVVDSGESYQRARLAFRLLMRQYADAAFLVSQFVGGESYHRDHKDDPNGRDPLVPTSPAKQREALKFLQDHLLTDRPFQAPPELLRKLAASRWSHWGSEGGFSSRVDYDLNGQVLAVQQTALAWMLSPNTLRRVQNNAYKTAAAEKPLQMAEVFRSLSDSVWADLPGAKDAKPEGSSVIRRNLQRAYLKRLAGLALDGQIAPPDARSLARLHLREAGDRVEKALKAEKLDDTVRAHLEESKDRIAKVLSASLQASE